ncbi:MAG: zinc ribbon domain-containing protein [bacterium]|nr:zinc ribbon domain-containing protein [bacterium]
MFQCPQCRNYVDPGANVCPYCGFVLKQPNQYPPYTSSQQPPQHYPPPPYIPTNTTQRQDMSWIFIIIGVIVLVLCACIGTICFCYLLGQSSS